MTRRLDDLLFGDPLPPSDDRPSVRHSDRPPQTGTYSTGSADLMSGLDEMIGRLSKLVHQHRAHPERVRTAQRDLDRLVELKVRMLPPPSFVVRRDDLLAPDQSVTMPDGVTVFGRFAWSRLMRTVHAPWPEHLLEPDQDFGRDAPPC